MTAGGAIEWPADMHAVCGSAVHYSWKLLTTSFSSLKAFTLSESFDDFCLINVLISGKWNWAVKFAKISLVSRINFADKYPIPGNVFIESFIVSFVQTT